MFLRLFFLPLLLLAIASLAEADGGNIHITGNLTAQSCTVDGATDFTLSLGTVDRADLPSVGSTANQVGLNIPLSCISGTKVIIQIDGTSISDNNTVMVNTGTAEGGRYAITGAQQ
ncbi:type 1 fimbriae major subunit FimA [Klebsiella michiganensis]|nr:type 1 fimbriae major subunit FimA [Klebsiella michiganensis]